MPTYIFIVHAPAINDVILNYILSKDRKYRFLSFNTGEECLYHLHTNPDLIIMDYTLSNTSDQTLHRIKEHNPKIQLIVFNDKSGEKKTDPQKFGIDDYIIKHGHGENQIIQKIDELLNEMNYLQLT